MLVKMNCSSGESEISAPELLWVCPNIDQSSYGAITINESSEGWVSGKHWNDYDGFLIATRSSQSEADKRAEICYVVKDITTISDTEFVTEHNLGGGAQIFTVGMYGRPYTLLSDGISIEAGQGYGSPYARPWYIWGVKGELTI